LDSLRARFAERSIGAFELTPAKKTHSVDQTARGIAHFFVKIFGLIEIVVAGRIGAIVANVAVDQGRVAGGNKAHVRQPVRENSPERFRAGGVAVHDDGKEPAGEMARVVPSFELHFLGALGIFPAGERRVGVAAIGADEPIDHEL